MEKAAKALADSLGHRSQGGIPRMGWCQGRGSSETGAGAGSGCSWSSSNGSRSSDWLSSMSGSPGVEVAREGFRARRAVMESVEGIGEKEREAGVIPRPIVATH